MGGGCVCGGGAWMCLERWKRSATALIIFSLHMYQQGRPFPVDACTD
jgi:hypothetical protein